MLALLSLAHGQSQAMWSSNLLVTHHLEFKFGILILLYSYTEYKHLLLSDEN